MPNMIQGSIGWKGPLTSQRSMGADTFPRSHPIAVEIDADGMLRTASKRWLCPVRRTRPVPRLCFSTMTEAHGTLWSNSQGEGFAFPMQEVPAASSSQQQPGGPKLSAASSVQQQPGPTEDSTTSISASPRTGEAREPGSLKPHVQAALDAHKALMRDLAAKTADALRANKAVDDRLAATMSSLEATVAELGDEVSSTCSSVFGMHRQFILHRAVDGTDLYGDLEEDLGEDPEEDLAVTCLFR